MNPTDVLLLTLDLALADKWESLESAIADLSDEEAEWQPPAYAREAHDAEFGFPGTILWHLNHLEYYHRHYAAVLRARPVDDQPETPLPGELRLQAILPKLKQSNAELRNTIADLKPEDLAAPCTSRTSTAPFVLNAARHITWHAAQIRQTRRLYEHR